MLHATMNVDQIPRLVAERWLQAFEASISSSDTVAAAGLFAHDAHWRDCLALSWHFRGVSGADTIVPLLLSEAARIRPRNFRVPDGRTQPRRVTRVGVETIEAIFEFETDAGQGTGVVRFVADPANPENYVAWTLMTSLEAC